MTSDTKRPGPSVRSVPEGDTRERLVCPDCGFIQYDNPKVVVGSVARWNGTSLEQVGSDLPVNSSAAILTFAGFDDGSGAALYAAGQLDTGDGRRGHVFRWDGVAWEEIGPALNEPVLSLAVFDDGSGPALYAGGAFTSDATGTPIPYFARWDGSQWVAIGSGPNYDVTCLVTADLGYGPVLVLGGRFTQAGATPANRVAAFDGSTSIPHTASFSMLPS